MPSMRTMSKLRLLFRRVGDEAVLQHVDQVEDVEHFVFVESNGEHAAVATGNVQDSDFQFLTHGVCSFSSSQRNTGPSLQVNLEPIMQWQQVPVAQYMSRSSET